MRIEERADLLHARPRCLVIRRKGRPDNAARRAFKLLGRPGHRRAERAVGIVIDEALPHRAVARELDDFDVLLRETGIGDDRERVLVQRGRAHHETEPLAAEILPFLDAGVLGDADRQSVAVDRRERHLQGLRTPFLDAELEHAFLREINAGAHPCQHRAVRAQRRETCDVVACGEHTHVRTVFVLHHLADADGNIETRCAGVVGGEGHRRRQLDVLRLHG